MGEFVTYKPVGVVGFIGGDGKRHKALTVGGEQSQGCGEVGIDAALLGGGGADFDGLGGLCEVVEDYRQANQGTD